MAFRHFPVDLPFGRRIVSRGLRGEDRAGREEDERQARGEGNGIAGTKGEERKTAHKRTKTERE
jgi:hypothetical protein